MKQIITVLLLLAFSFGYSQTEDEEFDTYPKVDWMFRANYFYPFASGENALAKAHDSNLGWGFEIGLVEYRRFKLFMGYNYSPYPITDKTLIGNIDKSNYTSFYGSVSYEFPISEKISLLPDLGFGAAKLALRTGQQRFGHQTGADFRLGGIGVYKLNDTFGLYLGVHYIHTKLYVHTNQEYEKFFGRASQVQFAVGLQID